MAYEETLRSITLTSDSSIVEWTSVPGAPGSPTDNAGFQYRFVKVTGVHTAGLAVADTTALLIGVLQNKPQVVGNAATVAYQGVSRVRCSKAITAGSLVYATANGRATDSSAGGGSACGLALTTTANADELVVVILRLN